MDRLGKTAAWSRLALAEMCAAKGLLNKQSSRKIVFAHAPKDVHMDGWPPFGRCSGYTNKRCDTVHGFANDDIYPLEVCLFSQVCENNGPSPGELFGVGAGQPFVCQTSVPGFRNLQAWLLEGPSV